MIGLGIKARREAHYGVFVQSESIAAQADRDGRGGCQDDALCWFGARILTRTYSSVDSANRDATRVSATLSNFPLSIVENQVARELTVLPEGGRHVASYCGELCSVLPPPLP